MAIVVAAQALAAMFFTLDVLGDLAERNHGGHLLIEGAAVVALIVAVGLGAFQTRALILTARHDETAVALARGAATDLIRLRFEQWRLTPAEADVALFALKGCDAGEIAAMRGAATGTVRAQLTKVYGKAGVSSQSSLIALFLEDLIDPALHRDSAPTSKDNPI